MAVQKVPGTQNGIHSSYSSETNRNLNTYRASGMVDMENNPGGIAITTTNIEVLANGVKIGFIQSASPSESRNIIKVQELGTEGVVQAVPGNTNGGQLSLSRFALYNSTLMGALGLVPSGIYGVPAAMHSNYVEPAGGGQYNVGSGKNPFKTLKDQRVPIEIKMKTRKPIDYDGNGGWYEEAYVDCWLSSYSKTIASSTITITEQATIQYSDIYVNPITSRDKGKTTGHSPAGDSVNATGLVRTPYTS